MAQNFPLSLSANGRTVAQTFQRGRRCRLRKNTVFVVLVESWPTVRIPCRLPAVGGWTLRVRGENAKGEGEWSDEFAVTVAA